MWPAVKQELLDDLNDFKMGSPDDMGNFINAVIDERAFDKIASYIDFVKEQKDAKIIAGGGYDKVVVTSLSPLLYYHKSQIPYHGRRDFWTCFNHLCIRR